MNFGKIFVTHEQGFKSLCEKLFFPEWLTVSRAFTACGLEYHKISFGSSRTALLLAMRRSCTRYQFTPICSKLIIQNKIKTSDSSKLRSRDIAKFLHYVFSQGPSPLIYLITTMMRDVYNILKLCSVTATQWFPAHRENNDILIS